MICALHFNIQVIQSIVQNTAKPKKRVSDRLSQLLNKVDTLIKRKTPMIPARFVEALDGNNVPF